MYHVSAQCWRFLNTLKGSSLHNVLDCSLRLYIYIQLSPSTADIWDDNFKLQDPQNEHHFTSIFSSALSNTEQKQPRLFSQHDIQGDFSYAAADKQLNYLPVQPKCCQDPAKWELSLWWQIGEFSQVFLHIEVDEDYLLIQLIKCCSAGSIPEYKKKVVPSQIIQVPSLIFKLQNKNPTYCRLKKMQLNRKAFIFSFLSQLKKTPPFKIIQYITGLLLESSSLCYLRGIFFQAY